jgi:Helicase conserved C-terminal domain/SNF2-related domain
VELPVRVASAASTKKLIAAGYLGDESVLGILATDSHDPDVDSLGDIRLHPHQISAVQRLRRAMDEFGGGLLSDEAGMGKTFVALAIARDFQSTLVIAPAILRDMWLDQAGRARSRIDFTSFESLSRGRLPGGTFDLVVMDEAHHARNPSTRRYREIVSLTRRSRVLMLSATPIHNSKRDLIALLSIFLGSRATAMTPNEMARCVVRRRIDDAGIGDNIPATESLRWIEIEDDDSIPRALLALPPPIPPSDGGDAGVLTVRGLLRQWCSSDAALAAALRRRIARSIALISALEAGRYPSREELAAWTIADDSVQLGFPELLATAFSGASELLSTIREHDIALRDLLSQLGTPSRRDRERAAAIARIRNSHHGLPVVAFSQYAETVNALYRGLRSEARVGVLTSRGARVAGGMITRSEALSRFAPRASGANDPREAERIDLLLATDLLSEGVNLQDAAVVIHLDLPWTAARLEQRIGRVARLGSLHRRVFAYGIRPSAAAESLILLETTIQRKIRNAEISVGGSRPLLPRISLELASDPKCSPQPISDPITTTERIRRVMQDWLGSGMRPEDRCVLTSGAIIVGATSSARDGFIALCIHGASRLLLSSDWRRMTDSPHDLLELLRGTHDVERHPTLAAITRAQQLLDAHFREKRTMATTEARSTVVARARAGLLNRVTAILRDSRPHERAALVRLCEMARTVVMSTLGAAAESDLVRLCASDLRDREWLEAVIRHGSPTQDNEMRSLCTGKSEIPQIIAILILDSTARGVT